MIWVSLSGGSRVSPLDQNSKRDDHSNSGACYSIHGRPYLDGSCSTGAAVFSSLERLANGFPYPNSSS